MSCMNKLRFARDGSLLISIIFYLAAAAYLLIQDIPPMVLYGFCGCLLIAYGVIKVVGFYSGDLYCLAFQYDFAFGILMIVMGMAVLLFQEKSVAYLPIGLGWFALADGLFKVQMAQDAKQFGLEKWKRIQITGFVTAVLSGVLILFSRNASVSHILTSLILLSEGIMNHCVVLTAVRKLERGRTEEEN